MFHLHCWHEDESTRRKIRNPKRCQSDKPNYWWPCSDMYIFNCIKFKSIDECCICHKKRITQGETNELGLEYPDILNLPLSIK